VPIHPYFFCSCRVHASPLPHLRYVLPTILFRVIGCLLSKRFHCVSPFPWSTRLSSSSTLPLFCPTGGPPNHFASIPLTHFPLPPLHRFLFVFRAIDPCVSLWELTPRSFISYCPPRSCGHFSSRHFTQTYFFFEFMLFFFFF